MIKNKLKIPEGWGIKSFGDCFFVAPKLAGLKGSEYEEGGKYPIIDQGQSFISGHTNNQELVQTKFPAIIFGDHTRVIKYVDFAHVLGNDGTKVFWKKEENDLKFLYYLLQTVDIPNTGYNRHYKYLEQAKLNIPPIQEQQKIAEILGTVDEDIEKTDEVIKQTEKLKRGLMNELLTRGDKIQINKIVEINPEQIVPQKEIEYSYIDIASVEDFKVNNFKTFLGKNAPSRARRLVKSNDVIISMVRPNLRAFSFVLEKYNNFLCSTGFCVLRAKKALSYPKYLYYSILKDDFVDYLIGKTTGSNYPAVNSNDIGEFCLNLPNLGEQKKIAEILSSVDVKISIYKELKDQLLKLKKGLMSDLLSGRVRVK